MDYQKKSMLPVSSTSAEILQAQAELWCHAFGYLKSMALHSAIKLGISDALSRCGGAASLSELHAVLDIPPTKQSFLARLMRFLALSGVFGEDDSTPASQVVGSDQRRYRLTAVSRLLVGCGGLTDTCLSPFIAICVTPYHFAGSLCLAEWLVSKDDRAATETPFMMAHGTDLWGMIGHNAKFGAQFNSVMASDSRFVSGIVVRECGEVFAGVESLVDVGGGDGTMAKAIAEAFPVIRCKVLELPQIVSGMPVLAEDDNGNKVEFVAGDMMEFIPPADALLLKFILHDWSDEDCVRILKRCKEAVSAREPKGKLIIIDSVVGSVPNQTLLEAQLLIDLSMMVLLTGKEREERQWSRLFTDAGFTRYRIRPVLGCRSIIEVYP